MSLEKKLRVLNKIHIRQGLTFTLMFSVGMAIAFVWVFSSLYRSLMNDARDSVTSTLLAKWALYRDEGKSSLIRSIRSGQNSDSLILLTDEAGKNLAVHIPGNQFRDLIPQLRDYPYPVYGLFNIRDPDGKRLTFYTGALHINEAMTLRVIINMDRSLATFRKMQQRFFEVILVLLLTSFVGGTLSTIGALQPINHLNRELSALSVTADIRRRLAVRGSGDQLDSLILQINRFLSRIESLVTGMRQALDNTAHDLRTPLARMKVRAESVLVRENPGTDEMRDALVACMEESETIIRMVDSLLDISEAEQGVLHLNLTNIDLVQSLKEIHDLYNFVADEKGTHLILDLPGRESPFQADPVRFRQILGNLLDNAIKFSPSGSTVTLQMSYLNSDVQFIITDQGPGIAETDLPHIWNRLYRGETSRTTRGLGLGLSLVKALVEAHGGRVSAANNPSGGARFTVKLPYSQSSNITKL